MNQNKCRLFGRAKVGTRPTAVHECEEEQTLKVKANRRGGLLPHRSLAPRWIAF